MGYSGMMDLIMNKVVDAQLRTARKIGRISLDLRAIRSCYDHLIEDGNMTGRRVDEGSLS